MRVYHICDCCQQIYHTEDIQGPEGAIELKGTCDDCIREMGLDEPVVSLTAQHFYN